MAVKPVVYDDSTKKHRPLGSGEKMDGLSASSIISSQSGNLITTGSDGLAYATGSGIADPAADNLIEATSGGRLKVDMDRIVEWLDGHSSDASALADAINVVSADSGNVIVEGTDNGAYLSKAVLANAIGSMTDAQLQSLAAAIADGQTIVASGGKLIVDPTNATAAKLKKITAVLYKAQGGLAADSSTGKLYVDFDAMSADTKRNIVLSMVDLDGGLAVHDSGAKKGTIYVDFTSMDPAIMRAVVLNMVQQGGGLSVDSNGQLYVDFDSMPTDKFDAMMASLRMLVPLESNKTVYVNPADDHAADPGIDATSWGESRTYNASRNIGPFASISGAVNYVTRKYALGTYHITVRVVAGTYNENVTLPEFSRSTGYIAIYPDSYDANKLNPNHASYDADYAAKADPESPSYDPDFFRDVHVVAQLNSAGSRGWCFNASGAGWHLYYMHAERIENPTSAKGQAFGCYQSAGSGSVLHLYGCAAVQSFPLNPAPLGGQNYTVRVVNADSGGVLHIHHGVVPGKISVQRPVSGVWPAVHALSILRDGKMYLRGSYDEDNVPVTTPYVDCSGTAHVFCRASQVGAINTLGGGALVKFRGANYPTDSDYDDAQPANILSGTKRFELINGSYVSSGQGLEYFPGDTDGTLENGEDGADNTCCWYK